MKMMNANKNGMKAAASVKAEVVKLAPDFIEVKYRDKTYRLDFEHYPWFRYCTLDELFNVQGSACGLHWPDADIDLEVDFIDNPPEHMANMSIDNWLRWRRNYPQIEAGRKGGQHSSGNFANNRERAASAGRKGGQASSGQRQQSAANFLPQQGSLAEGPATTGGQLTRNQT